MFAVAEIIGSLKPNPADIIPGGAKVLPMAGRQFHVQAIHAMSIQHFSKQWDGRSHCGTSDAVVEGV
jgi:hypothetical protein